MTEEEAEEEFRRCYYYGTSTSNQQIEAWWGQLSKGQLSQWRVSKTSYFINKNI